MCGGFEIAYSRLYRLDFCYAWLGLSVESICWALGGPIVSTLYPFGRWRIRRFVCHGC